MVRDKNSCLVRRDPACDYGCKFPRTKKTETHTSVVEVLETRYIATLESISDGGCIPESEKNRACYINLQMLSTLYLLLHIALLRCQSLHIRKLTSR